MALHRLGELAALSRRAEFKQFLNNVVAKHVLRERERVGGHDLVEHSLGLLRGRLLELLLNEARPMLVSAELNDEPCDVLQFPFTCLVRAEFFQEGGAQCRVLVVTIPAAGLADTSGCRATEALLLLLLLHGVVHRAVHSRAGHEGRRGDLGGVRR